MANGGALTQPINRERWTQLIAGIICMIMIANLQYGWTLFVRPINAAHGWSIASIQVAFSHLRRAGNLADARGRLDRRSARRPARTQD